MAINSFGCHPVHKYTNESIWSLRDGVTVRIIEYLVSLHILRIHVNTQVLTTMDSDMGDFRCCSRLIFT